jgi:hypothetical protein
MQVIKLVPLMSVEESDLLAGKLLTREDCKTLITKDADVYDKESGACLAKFRKGVIPGRLLTEAYENLLPAAKPTDTRVLATKNNTVVRTRKDGSVSKQQIAQGFVNSGVVGYYDRAPRFPFCRQTAYTQHHFDKFQASLGIVHFVDQMYKKLMPKEYKAQRALADKTSKDFKIHDTSFTTVTVNKNYRTAVHKDAGDFKGGFGNLVALRKGEFEGCYLTLPRWGVGFDLRNGDLLLMDVHQWHGNTPFIPLEKGATRLSLVMYYRENMIYCGTAQQEVNRAKNRKRGDKLTKAK